MSLALDIYHKLTGNELPKKNLELEIEAVQQNNEELSGYLKNLQGNLNDAGKESVIKAAFYVAMADGEFQQEERDLIVSIASDLGMTQAHLRGVLGGA